MRRQTQPKPAAVLVALPNTLVGLVERILTAKRASPSAETTALEREIDARVYRLYALTPDEIKLVEAAAG